MSRSPVRLRSLAAVFIVAASFIPVRAKAQDDYKEARNADVDARGARLARIEAGAGSLRVEGREGISRVQIRGTARSRRRDDLKNIKLTAERRGDEVFIKAELPDNNREGWRVFSGDFPQVALDLVIEVPTSLALDVEDSSGEARFINTGALDLEDGSGEVEIRSARGDVDIVDGSGSITIDGVEGNVRISDGSGEIRAENITGDFIVRDDGSGDIRVSGVGGTVRVDDDGSGSIDVDRVAGDFVVRSDGGGGISFHTVKGNVRIPEKRRRG